MLRHPMVDYLNSLRTQERGANPTYVHENRATFLASLRRDHPWFPEDGDLQISTKLDGLVSNLASASPSFDVVLLTGDAGDGKTAICASLAGAVDPCSELDEVTLLGGWTIVKDASEILAERLEDLLRHFHLERPENETGRLIVAINEGRLRRVAERVYPEGHPFRTEILDPALDPSLSSKGAAALDEAMLHRRVLVLNFRHRASVRTAVPALLGRWTPANLWEGSPACSECSARERCPILANAKDLRSDIAQSRLGDLLMSALLSGQRLPLRRLQALLALVTTGGLSCESVQDGPLGRSSSALDRLRYRYYEALFRSDARGPVAVQPEAVCLALRPVDPGMASDRAFDERVAVRVRDAEPTADALGDGFLGVLELTAMKAVSTGDADETVDALSDRLARLTRSLRRWRALAATPPADLQRWLRAVSLMESCINNGDEEDLRRVAVDALNRLHLVEKMKTDRITRRQIDAAGFREPVRRALELDLQTEFETTIEKSPVLPGRAVAPWFEHGAADVFLCASPAGGGGSARLLLDARLVYALLGVKDGYQQLGALGAYRRDLARFFSRLVQLAVEAGTWPLLSILVDNVRFKVAESGKKLDLQPE